jgi:hypothetical protein
MAEQGGSAGAPEPDNAVCIGNYDRVLIHLEPPTVRVFCSCRILSGRQLMVLREARNESYAR